MSYKRTDEQEACVEAKQTGGNLLIEAGAGAGKTSTLLDMATSDDGRGYYVAFNTSIKEEAKTKFPKRTNCLTFHGLAFGPIGKDYQHRLPPRGKRVPARQAAKTLGISGQTFNVAPDRTLPDWQIARLAQDTVEKFCQSADERITNRHVPYVKGADYTLMDELRAIVVPLANVIWADLQRVNGSSFQFTHDAYLKMYQLSGPVLRGAYMMVDEAQDLNPCKTAIVEAQDHMQRILVGDRNQQLYAWSGAVDAMETFKADHHLTLTKSFRFGPAVATEANKWLDELNANIRIEGYEGVDSQVTGELTNPRAVLCRTNAGVVESVFRAFDEGIEPGVVGVKKAIISFAEGARDLQTGRKAYNADLAAFKTWRDVQQYVAEDEGGSDLKVMVRLIDNYGVDRVLDMGQRVVDVTDKGVSEEDVQRVITTAHKAKGREWPTVQVHNDFKEPEDADKGIPKAEAMLAYVTVTRAQYVLDPGPLSYIDNFGGMTAFDEVGSE